VFIFSKPKQRQFATRRDFKPFSRASLNNGLFAARSKNQFCACDFSLNPNAFREYMVRGF
jgi:hypothetical protein